MKISRRSSTLAIAFALIFPTALTLTYFVALAGQPSGIQQLVYVVGKTIQFGFPLLWTVVVLRERSGWLQRSGRGLLSGLGFGLAVGIAMFGLYALWLKPSGVLAGADEAIRHKVIDLGLSTPWRYAAAGVFYASFHALLEEYYWRWFVFGRLRERASLAAAISISSVGFMAHHVIVLATFFGWHSPATYVFSLAVAAGGAFWAWLYARSGTLYAPWASHLLVDAAVFIVGYDLLSDLWVP